MSAAEQYITVLEAPERGPDRVGERCAGCLRRPIRLDTVDGVLVEIDDPCRCPEWRRLNAVCRWCDAPVTGRPKVALYCDQHRKLARKRSYRKYLARVGNQNGRAWYRRHRDEVLATARMRHRLDAGARERKNAYKREWRRKNRDKVRAQKRRAALRRCGQTPDYHRRYMAEVAAGIRTPQRAPRNERGERLCLTPGCRRVMKGRAKKCEPCKRRPTV